MEPSSAALRTASRSVVTDAILYAPARFFPQLTAAFWIGAPYSPATPATRDKQ